MALTRRDNKVQSPTAPATAEAVLSPGNSYTLEDLEAIARQVRRDIVQMTYTAGSGHPGGSLSAVEILTALYLRIMRHDPKNPHWPNRDRFILSKGHACPVLYAMLAQCGYLPQEELWTFRKINSRLQGHVHIGTPGVEMSGGSLGQGLSFGLGTALAARIDKQDHRVYVLLGDGECDEGQVWEAAMATAHYKVENLTAIVDRNRIQNDRFTHEVIELEPLADKWRAFGWRVLEVDGHNLTELLEALNEAKAIKGMPAVIIARTVKGKGVSFMENNPDFHGKAPSEEQYQQAMKELA